MHLIAYTLQTFFSFSFPSLLSPVQSLIVAYLIFSSVASPAASPLEPPPASKSEPWDNSYRRDAPAVASVPAHLAQPWNNTYTGNIASIYTEGPATIAPGAGDRTFIGSPTPGNNKTGTYSCIVFPPSGWVPAEPYDPCAHDNFDYPSCALNVPPQSEGGDPSLPWITCLDGTMQPQDSKTNGQWSMNMMQHNPAFAVPLPYTNTTWFGYPPAGDDVQYQVNSGWKGCVCMEAEYNPLGMNVCLYVACADWTDWNQGPTSSKWPWGKDVWHWPNQ